MKKFLSFLVIATMTISFTSCFDDDDPENHVKIEKALNGFIVKTMSNGNVINLSNCEMSLKIDLTDESIDLGINNVSFAPKMPKISFTANGLKATSFDNNRITFTGTGIEVMSGYTLNDVHGLFNNALNTLVLTYAVSSQQGQYEVLTHSSLLYSQLPDGEYDYSNATDKFYKFASLIEDNSFKASIYIDNIQFVPQMPKLEEICIPLDDATIVQNANGYTATAETIVPYFKQGGTFIPFTDRTISNLKYNLDVRAQTFSIEFDCFGLHYTDSGKIQI